MNVLSDFTIRVKKGVNDNGTNQKIEELILQLAEKDKEITKYQAELSKSAPEKGIPSSAKTKKKPESKKKNSDDKPEKKKEANLI
jgi:hypothetical protein